MKKSLLLILLAITFAACSSSEENSVAPSKEQCKFTTLSSNSVPDFDHVSGILLSSGYTQVPRPNNFVDQEGFVNYEKVQFFSNSSETFGVYGWKEDNLPGTPNNPTPTKCDLAYSETPQPDGTTKILCVGDGNGCSVTILVDDKNNPVGVLITVCPPPAV